MKSLLNLAGEPVSTPILADDVLEFHALRLLLLFKVCGTANRIDGLTKMAKLDFFIRYPVFFVEVSRYLGDKKAVVPRSPVVESSMVRFHYGPWDQRYYHILSYLEAKGLLAVQREGNTFQFALTRLGQETASKAMKLPAFAEMVEHMKQVKRTLGGKSGTALKSLVYEVFGKEVADRPLGEVIE